MKRNQIRVLVAVLLLAKCLCMQAQGTTEDYRRAYTLSQKFSANKVLYSNVTPHWIGGSHAFWYVRNTEKGPVYMWVDADKKSKKELFDHQQLAECLNQSTKRNVQPDRIYLDRLSVDESMNVLRFVFDGKNWKYTLDRNLLEEKGKIAAPGKQRHWMETDDEKTANPVLSPDRKYTAYIKNHNIYVKEQATGKEKQLSHDGTLGNYYSAYIRWSPDSRRVASCKIRPVE